MITDASFTEGHFLEEDDERFVAIGRVIAIPIHSLYFVRGVHMHVYIKCLCDRVMLSYR